MSEVTIVCCYNNEKVYGDLVSTLKAQTCPNEIIGIDNRGNKAFTSCASAYNSVINQVRTKYVIYSHQDILLNDKNILEKFMSYLKRTERNDILGAAGVRFDSPYGFSNVTHISSKTGELVHGTAHFPENGIMECDTVDECFFGGYTEHFREYRFDEVICDNWHFYAAESCLRTKTLPEGKRGTVRVCDVPLLHLSRGTISPAFQWGFYRLCRKYSRAFPFIKTTSAGSRTDFIHVFPRFVYLWSHSMAGVIFRKLGIYETMKKILP